MQIQVNTDNSIQDRGTLVEDAEEVVAAALSRFGDRITRVEVHLSDDNSHKSGADDKRCVMEARLAGLPPLAVTHNADTFSPAIHGAADKLKRLIDSKLGRLSAH